MNFYPHQDTPTMLGVLAQDKLIHLAITGSLAAYVDQLIGAKITGLTSGITAVVGEVLLADDSERNALTLYCNYISVQQLYSDNRLFCLKINCCSCLYYKTPYLYQQ